ncbi:hypothetical protein vseg_014880 [Gypsophila vaccaria]
MQDPKSLKTRRPWYQRAIEMSPLCKILFKPQPTTIKSNEIPHSNPNTNTNTNTNTTHKLKKSTSLKVATSFTRVCLCAPIIPSYNINNDMIFNNNVDIVVPPRRSYSYPRSSTSKQQPFATPPMPVVHAGRQSIEGRRVFRGKSLTDNVLMRRFVVEEEAMAQLVRRMNQLDVIRKRAVSRRKKIGPSPLSTMVLAQDEDNQEC